MEMVRRMYWPEVTLIALLSMTAMVAPAQTFTTLATFDGTNGGAPYYMSLVQGTDGNFYGTTSVGGAHSRGTVFSVTPSGTLTTLYSFTGGADGTGPYAALIQATDGNLYGTTAGGDFNGGTVFGVFYRRGTVTALWVLPAKVDCLRYGTALRVGPGVKWVSLRDDV